MEDYHKTSWLQEYAASFNTTISSFATCSFTQPTNLLEGATNYNFTPMEVGATALAGITAGAAGFAIGGPVGAAIIGGHRV